MAGAISFTLRGVQAMQSAIDAIAAGMIDDLVIAVREEAEEVMRRAKTEFVPINESTLMLSGFVNDVVRKGNDVMVDMGFGGDADEYAMTVHETPSKFDPATWKGVNVRFNRGGSKYLERPLMEATQGMNDRIAKKVAPK